jgi:uncharacterized protein (TIGR02145 family)/uncharacterized repeat protein (TIGR02543 family)
VKQLATAPERTGYVFVNWYKDAACSTLWVFDKDTVTSSITLYAKWLIKVLFDSQGGAAVQSQTLNANSLVKAPAPAPTNKGCTFAGWFRDKKCTNPWGSFDSIKVTAPITLYAKWTVFDADSNAYTIVNIGNQVWLTENLKTTKYNTGEPITLVTDSLVWSDLSTQAYCWPVNSSGSKNPFGALYNWYAVNTGKLAPKGWQIATDAEWDTLVSSLGGPREAGRKLKMASYWLTPTDTAGGKPNNESGFSAYPGGFRYDNGKFSPLNCVGYWWTNTEVDSINAWNRELFYNYNSVGHQIVHKMYGASVRCVRD